LLVSQSTNITGRDWLFENAEAAIRGAKSITVRAGQKFKLSIVGLTDSFQIQPWRSTNDPVLKISEAKDHRSAFIEAAEVGTSRIEVPGLISIEISVIEDPAATILLGQPTISLKKD
jgi:hypothetical protein